MNKSQTLDSSFRDPSGFLFKRQGSLYRQVNRAYAENYNRLMDSGLYGKLVKAGLLIPHTEVAIDPPEPKLAFKVIQPEPVPFISYPYEWSFGQLKDAALVTLSIQKRALKAGLTLKDASAYNIQFYQAKPTLIDSLSFEIYQEGEPWVAYRQFCQHFLAPLALMAYRDVRLNQLLRVFLDGVPLDLASALLPVRTRYRLGLGTHLHLHARAQRRFAEVSLVEARGGRKMSQTALIGLIESLQSTVRGLQWKPAGTEWAEYYQDNNYTDAAFEHKQNLIREWLETIQPKTVWDLGANVGLFSREAASLGIYTLSFDIDPAAVERNYQQVKTEKQANLLPLVLDLTNPSPAIGWHNRERQSLLERGPAEVVLALALIHHLAIANNVPLDRLAQFFVDLGGWLIVEWIPKDDSQVQKLLRSRQDIFQGYTREAFEQSFGQFYEIQKVSAIRDSERSVYLMKRK